MDATDAKSTLDDIVTVLRDWFARSDSAMSFADWAELTEEIKDNVDGYADSIDEVGTWIEDDSHKEAADSIADDLEGQHAPEPESDEPEDNTFEAGLAAAVTFLREQY